MARILNTVTAYQSPNSVGLVADAVGSTLAVVNLTKMLNTAIVPRTAGGHGCAAGTLPATVVPLLSVP